MAERPNQAGGQSRRDNLTPRRRRGQGESVGDQPASRSRPDPVAACASLADPIGLAEFLGIAGMTSGGFVIGEAGLGTRVSPSRVKPADVLRCRVVWRLVAELFAAACEHDLPEGVARRRPRCHMRQIAMYVSHVVLSVPYPTIAMAFGRDRSTVTHACSVVEDRRDDQGYDRFVERCERCINAVFAPFGQPYVDR